MRHTVVLDDESDVISASLFRHRGRVVREFVTESNGILPGSVTIRVSWVDSHDAANKPESVCIFHSQKVVSTLMKFSTFCDEKRHMRQEATKEVMDAYDAHHFKREQGLPAV